MSQRKNYVVDKGMQSKFIVTLLLLIFLVAVITVCNVYVIYEYVQSGYNPAADPSTRSFFGVAVDLLGFRLFLIGLVNIIIVGIIGVFYSHQFAGPSYKIEKSLLRIAEGDLSFLVTLRKNDSMHNIAESLNMMIENFRNALRKATDLTGQIKDTSTKIHTDDEVVIRHVAALKGITGELEDLLAGFKLIPDLVNPDALPPEDGDEKPIPPPPAPDSKPASPAA